MATPGETQKRANLLRLRDHAKTLSRGPPVGYWSAHRMLSLGVRSLQSWARSAQRTRRCHATCRPQPGYFDFLGIKPECPQKFLREPAVSWLTSLAPKRSSSGRKTGTEKFASFLPVLARPQSFGLGLPGLELSQVHTYSPEHPLASHTHGKSSAGVDDTIHVPPIRSSITH